MCWGSVIQGEPGSGLVCVHMHTGVSTFTHHTLHTHRAVCAGHAVLEHTHRAHVHTPKPYVDIKAPPWFSQASAVLHKLSGIYFRVSVSLGQ